jgi:hypothetical protein
MLENEVFEINEIIYAEIPNAPKVYAKNNPIKIAFVSNLQFDKQNDNLIEFLR